MNLKNYGKKLNERTLFITKLAVSHFLLPVLFTAFVYIFSGISLLPFAAGTILIFIIYFAGYWEFTGMNSRVLITIFFQAMMLIALITANPSMQMQVAGNKAAAVVYSILTVFLLLQLVRIMSAICHKEKESVEITFPMRNGTYMITDGGNSETSRLMNYHFYSPVHVKNGTNGSMKFAIDAVKITDSSGSFFLRSNKDYPVFGEPVFSAIDGVVTKVENSIPDNIPFSGNYPYNTGNTIIVSSGDIHFLIGHLKQGSAAVEEGMHVKAGQLLAAAGNSGMSERPHIHMQMIMCRPEESIWKGRGVSMIFRNRNLYKNRILQL